uniref:Reverse transcriptase domain-containing protein n=1 Tax=Tanacetum cinerariifolium TaxID=118510 RepID=A0A699GI43_TANCI|nr:reverse transcriptase domain-containing protein [Tanacetum cinerariifolium]
MNYSPLEKLAMSLLHMSRRLRMYFQAHPIKVITEQSLKQILNRAQASGKLAKYSVELGAYNITYEPRNAIKGHVLADFLSEAPTLFTDGASNSKGSEASLVLISPSGVEFTYALRLNFTSTNNKAKYEALLARLCIARKMKVEDIDVKVDSKAIDQPKGGKCYRRGGRRQLDDAHHTLSGRRSMVERQGGKEGPENENKSVYPRGRCALQERVFGAHVKVCGSLTGQLCHQKNTYGILRNAHHSEVRGGKSYKARAPTPNLQKVKVRHRSHRLLHKMDRSKTVGQDYRERHKEVCVTPPNRVAMEYGSESVTS